LKPITKMIVTLLTASLVVVGCSQQASPTQTTDMQTAVAQTLAVMQTQINTHAEQTAVVVATTAVPTTQPTAAPTATALPTATQAATTAPVVIPTSPSPSSPSYRVGDVKDLNFPDGTYVNMGMHFTKIWQIKNIGTATWKADTKVISEDDNPLNASAYTLGQVVSPGQTVEIHLPMIAPQLVDTYVGKFLLKTSDGTIFGIGTNYDQPFWVKINTH